MRVAVQNLLNGEGTLYTVDATVCFVVGELHWGMGRARDIAHDNPRNRVFCPGRSLGRAECTGDCAQQVQVLTQCYNGIAFTTEPL